MIKEAHNLYIKISAGIFALTLVQSFVLFSLDITTKIIIFCLLSNLLLVLLFLYFTKKFLKRHNKTIYQEVVEKTRNAIIKFDLNGKVTFTNNYIEQLFGFSPTELIEKDIFDTLLPHFNSDKRQKTIGTKTWIHSLLRNIHKNPYYELWNVCKNGDKLFMGWTNTLIYNSKNEVSGILSIGVDKTKQKIILDKFKQNQQKFHDIFNSVNDGIIILSKTGELLEQNQAILKTLGITKKEISSSESLKKIFTKLIPNLDQLIKKIFLEGEVMLDHEFRNINGEKMTIEIRADKMMYNGQEAILAVGRNVINLRANQQKIFNAAIAAEEKERSRIAKELHDSVSPILSTIKLYIQSLHDATDENLKNTILARTEESINDSIASVNEISNNLSPHVLENFGLFEAVKTFSEKIEQASSIKIKVSSMQLNRLTQQTEQALYRVIIELLNNTVKYAEASIVSINFIQNNELLMLKYTDNGTGFNFNETRKQTKGMGLYNITNRIKSINGTITFSSDLNKGLIVNIHVPI